MNGRTKQNMPMYYQFYQTILDNKELLNINHAVKNKHSFLIIHGTSDEAVASPRCRRIEKRALSKGVLLSILNGDHTFE